jgi:hypothetical protein
MVIFILRINIWILKWYLALKIDIPILNIEIAITKFFIWIQKLLIESETWKLKFRNFII